MLSQYIWPDAAPTAIYADQIADRLFERGMPVELVGGSGTYRRSARDAPRAPITRLAHFEGRRGRLLSSYIEFRSVARAFERYIRENVGLADVVVVSSAPPTTLTLASSIRKQRAVGVYWLQDYYPEVLRGLREYPAIFRSLLSRYWDRALGKWDHVVKIGENLGYSGSNARTIRNWPTLSFSDSAGPSSKTALYTGNRGYCHDIDCFIAECQALVDAGYDVTVLGDGPGIAEASGVDQDWAAFSGRGRTGRRYAGGRSSPCCRPPADSAGALSIQALEQPGLRAQDRLFWLRRRDGRRARRELARSVFTAPR